MKKHNNSRSKSVQGAAQDRSVSSAAALRKAAEGRLRERAEGPSAGDEAEQPDAMQAALHELQVHQIELEMQNEELRQTHASLEEERARYVELYDQAPVGYCTLCVEGLILQVNLIAAAMLGQPRALLPKLPLARFVDAQDQDRFYLMYRQLMRSGTAFSVDLRLAQPQGGPLWVNLTANAATCERGALVARIALSDISQRKHDEQALRQGHDTLQAILSTSQDGYLRVDVCGRLLDVNASYCRQSGYTREELLTMQVADLEAAESEEEIALHMQRLTFEGYQLFETVHRRKDGSLWQVEVSSTWRARDGEPGLTVAFLRDISARKQAEEELRIAATAFESHEGIAITTADQVILRTNKAFTEITGYPAEEVVGRQPKLLSSGRHDDAFYAAMWGSIGRNGVWQGEIWNRRKSGEVFPEWLTITAVQDEKGRTTHYVAAFNDVSSRKSAEEQIRTLAFYDALTGLPNRRLFLDRLEQAIALGLRHPHKGALLFVDLDNFKTVNDTLGHQQGDLLLAEVAKRLTTCVREGDTVARLGGDEFLVMLENLSEDTLDAANQAEVVGEKILATLSRFCQLDGVEQHITASIGVTLFGGDQHEATDGPMKRADLAMYQAKAAGRNTLRFFDPQMQAVVTNRAALETGLRKALELGQLVLHYQPQLDAQQRLIGAEALVRWNHPQRGLVPPAEFISIAEDTGLIVPLGQWVLESACAQLAQWAKQPQLRQLKISVNVSARQFHQNGFVANVLEVLARHGGDPHRLNLELTESLLVSNIDGVVVKMGELKSNGLGFALDDFGTGFSSLSYLKRLPLDQLKIDQVFVRDILIDPQDAAIARVVIALAHNFGLSVMAEGVETLDQLSHLVSLGCQQYQGFLFSRPLPLAEFEAFARQHASAGAEPA